MDVLLGLPKTLRKHPISLVSGASFLNLSRYLVNSIENVELKTQVDLKFSSTQVVENTSVNRTIDECSRDEIACGLGPK